MAEAELTVAVLAHIDAERAVTTRTGGRVEEDVLTFEHVEVACARTGVAEAGHGEGDRAGEGRDQFFGAKTDEGHAGGIGVFFGSRGNPEQSEVAGADGDVDFGVGAKVVGDGRALKRFLDGEVVVVQTQLDGSFVLVGGDVPVTRGDIGLREGDGREPEDQQCK